MNSQKGIETENKKERIIRLPHEISRFIYVRNLPHKITPEELYDIFGRFGAVRQIRRGISNKNRGTAFVVYEDLIDAKRAVESLHTAFHLESDEVAEVKGTLPDV